MNPDSVPIDRATLDAIISKHLQAYARRVGGRAERDAHDAGDSSAGVSIVLVDPDQTLFSGDEQTDIFAYSMYAHGYQLALELAALAFGSPFRPDEAAIAEILTKIRTQVSASIADERQKWTIPHS